MLFVQNEFAPLQKVVVGIADSSGPVPAAEDCYDPKSRLHVNEDTYPREDDLIQEIEGFVKVLSDNGVEVIRPSLLENTNQIFTRDIGFVIDDKFVITNMIAERSVEIQGLKDFLDSLPPENILRMPEGAYLEGGDIMPHGDVIFIGCSDDANFDKYKVARTNYAGVEFVKNTFPEYEVIAFELHKSDEDPYTNALHLDCCFQVLGQGHCLIHREGFLHESDVDSIVERFGEDNCIWITAQEMYDMGANVVSIAPNKVIAERSLTRINEEIRKRGYEVIQIKYSETAKMEGLLRCSTLPIKRNRLS